jgi:hypothetical protein
LVATLVATLGATLESWLVALSDAMSVQALASPKVWMSATASTIWWVDPWVQLLGLGLAKKSDATWGSWTVVASRLVETSEMM